MAGGVTGYDRIRRLENGVLLREVTIPAVAQGAPVELLHLTDLHLNIINQQDREENNPVLMSTYEHRKWLKNGAVAPKVAAAMEQAARAELTVITGDALDYLSYGAIELLEQLVWKPYPQTLVTLGNHEPMFYMGLPGTIRDTSPQEYRYGILQRSWRHDIYYTSRVLKDSVMVIAMDNGAKKFRPCQIGPLSRDLARARERGWTVLLFLHIPLTTGNPRDTQVPAALTDEWQDYHGLNFYARDPEGALLCDGSRGSNSDALVGFGVGEDEATNEVYRIITDSADILRGVFAGHLHSDFYTQIQGRRPDGTAAPIPQYVLHGVPYGHGHGIRICVEPKGGSL